MMTLKWSAAMVSLVLILAVSHDPRVILPAITLWVFAYLIGRASRPREEGPDMRITVEEVDLGVYHPGFGRRIPLDELEAKRNASGGFTIARKPRTR